MPQSCMKKRISDNRPGLCQEIKKVAVLGAGVMGSQIAAHLTNAGIEVLLFDLDQELVKKASLDHLPGEAFFCNQKIDVK